jgi:hypothetical protein
MPKPSKPTAEPKAPKAPKSDDIALVCGRTNDGKGLHVLRKRGQNLEAGVVQPLEEGKPLHGELVTLRQRGQTPLCDVEVHYATPTANAAPKPAVSATSVGSSDGETRGHPAQVASDTYRKNWDTIWKTKVPKKNLLN